MLNVRVKNVCAVCGVEMKQLTDDDLRELWLAGQECSGKASGECHGVHVTCANPACATQMFPAHVRIGCVRVNIEVSNQTGPGGDA